MVAEPTYENRTVGRLYKTEQIPIIAVLITAGHKVHEWSKSSAHRLVASFPLNEGDKSVHDTIRDYSNNNLHLDAKTLISTWMHVRDMTRNKGFAIGTSQAQTDRSGSN